MTDRIVALLDQGTIPWQRPWNPQIARGQRPLSIAGHFYRGVNRIVLGSAGYSSPVWLTIHQANLRGAHVRKGEKSWPAVFYRQIEVERENPTSGEAEQKRIPLLRVYPVFNAAQVEDLELPAIFRPESDWVPTLVAPQAVVDGYEDGPTVAHTGGGRAYYQPSTDSVHLPDPKAFSGEEEYFSTLFHELGHSTGHASRLGRKGITDATLFGSHAYSQEELVAELTASFLCTDCGIDRTIENSAAYIASWLMVLEGDRKLFVQAAGQAQRAADRIIGAEAALEGETAEVAA